jgi:hypothetical protein
MIVEKALQKFYEYHSNSLQILDSLTGKDGTLQGLGAYGILHLCMALIATLDDAQLIAGELPVVVRLYQIVEEAAAGYALKP